MPTKPRPNRAVIYAEVEPSLKERFAAFANERGSSFTAELEAALLRHMTYPPPELAPAPLPDAAPAGKRRRKNSNNPPTVP
jgi:hypothetical protein